MSFFISLIDKYINPTKLKWFGIHNRTTIISRITIKPKQIKMSLTHARKLVNEYIVSGYVDMIDKGDNTGDYEWETLEELKFGLSNDWDFKLKTHNNFALWLAREGKCRILGDLFDFNQTLDMMSEISTYMREIYDCTEPFKSFLAGNIVNTWAFTVIDDMDASQITDIIGNTDYEEDEDEEEEM